MTKSFLDALCILPVTFSVKTAMSWYENSRYKRDSIPATLDSQVENSTSRYMYPVGCYVPVCKKKACLKRNRCSGLVAQSALANMN